MLISASLLCGISVAAAAAGSGLLAGVVLAGVFAAVAARSGQPTHPLLRAAVLLALAVLAARTFGAYVVPESPVWAAVAVVVLAAAAAAVGADVPAAVRTPLAVVLLLAGASFTAICFGIEPPAGVPEPMRRLRDDVVQTTHWFDTPAQLGPFGILAAAALFVAPLLVLEPGVSQRRARVRVVVGTLAGVAVGAAALHQLGPLRLALSGVPLRDALAAADAAVLGTMLTAAAVLATLPAVLAGVAAAAREVAGARAAREGREQRTTALRALAVGAVAAAGAAVLSPTGALVTASVIAVTATVAGWSRKAIPRTSD